MRGISLAIIITVICLSINHCYSDDTNCKDPCFTGAAKIVCNYSKSKSSSFCSGFYTVHKSENNNKYDFYVVFTGHVLHNWEGDAKICIYLYGKDKCFAASMDDKELKSNLIIVKGSKAIDGKSSFKDIAVIRIPLEKEFSEVVNAYDKFSPNKSSVVEESKKQGTKKQDDSYSLNELYSLNGKKNSLLPLPIYPISEFNKLKAKTISDLQAKKKNQYEWKYGIPLYHQIILKNKILRYCNTDKVRGSLGWCAVPDNSIVLTEVHKLAKLFDFILDSTAAINNIKPQNDLFYDYKYLLTKCSQIIASPKDFFIGLKIVTLDGFSGSPVTIADLSNKDENPYGSVVAIVQGGPVKTADNNINTWAIPVVELPVIFAELHGKKMYEYYSADQTKANIILAEYFKLVSSIRSIKFMTSADTYESVTIFDREGGVASQADLQSLFQHIDHRTEQIQIQNAIRQNEIILSQKGLNFKFYDLQGAYAGQFNFSDFKNIDLYDASKKHKKLLHQIQTIKTACSFLEQTNKGFADIWKDLLFDRYSVECNGVKINAYVPHGTPPKLVNTPISKYMDSTNYGYLADIYETKVPMLIATGDNGSRVCYYVNYFNTENGLETNQSFFDKYLRFVSSKNYKWDISDNANVNYDYIYMPTPTAKFGLLRNTHEHGRYSYKMMSLAISSALDVGSPSLNNIGRPELKGLFVGITGFNSMVFPSAIASTNIIDLKNWAQWYFSILLTATDPENKFK